MPDPVVETNVPRITFIDHTGDGRSVDAAVGQSVMQAARDNDVAGIDGDCGGACACATCQIYVDPAWLARTGPRLPMEEAMLGFAENVQENSRLSCQIPVTPDLDGLIVRMPDSQQP